MNVKKKALGRGLSALLENPETDITTKNDMSGKYVVGAVSDISINKIEANPFQPRDKFEEEALQELAESIKEHGIIQPVTVRKLGYDKYQLISGERRFRAAALAGLTEMPAYIRIADDKQMLEMALIENIQRQNLNALEIAISFQRLIDECKLTQETLSASVGKNRSTVANYLRLLKLPEEIQTGLRDNIISMGHARALINIENKREQILLYNRIVSDGLSVRKTEELARHVSETIFVAPTVKSPKPNLPEEFNEAKEKLKVLFGNEVDIKRNKLGKGKLSINFNSDEDLQRIIALLHSPIL
jgi:ParB family chromosome partitioning protein